MRTILENNLKTPDPSCAPFINKCLQILDKRYAEKRAGRRATLPDSHRSKKFSERELSEETGLNWPALKDGRRRTNPSREMVMAVADYLECSLHERNELLGAASYSPVEVLLRGAELEAALKPCRVLLYKYMHYPAYIINRDWNILEFNPLALKFFDLAAEDLQTIAPNGVNMLELVFDPALPVRSMFERVSPTNWRQFARRELMGFRWENRLCQYEEWYKNFFERLRALPDFESIYADSDIADFNEHEVLEFGSRFQRLNGGVVSIKSIFARTGHGSYPQVIFAVPGDTYSEEVFRQLGLQLPTWHDKYIVL